MCLSAVPRPRFASPPSLSATSRRVGWRGPGTPSRRPSSPGPAYRASSPPSAAPLPPPPLHPSHHTQARPGSARAGVLLCRRTSHRHPTPPHHRSTLPDVDVEIALHILPHDICSLCRLLDVSNAADAVRGLPLKPAECFQAGPRIVPPVARNVTAAMTFVYVVVRRARTSLRCRRMTAS